MPGGFVKSGDQGFMFVLHEIDVKFPAKIQKKVHLYDTIMPGCGQNVIKRNKNIWGSRCCLSLGILAGVGNSSAPQTY